MTADQIEHEIELIGSGGHLADPVSLALKAFESFIAPEDISTLEYSQNYRKFRSKNGADLNPWCLETHPYTVGAMNALDDPKIRAVIIPKPARSGGTVIAENYLLKQIEFGQFLGCLWYLAGPVEAKTYGDDVFSPMIDDHIGVARRLDAVRGRQGNTTTRKKFRGATVSILAISKTTTTNRQEGFIVMDEVDSMPKAFRSSFVSSALQRGRMLGNKLKIFACSHPDMGWVAGIGQAWLASSKGIVLMQCAECDKFASPYPTKHWQGVPRFTLEYTKLPELSAVGDRIRIAGETARLGCPHCGVDLTEEQRREMIGNLSEIHDGQVFDPILGAVGEPYENSFYGIWWHGLLVNQVSLSDLAKELETARENYQRTGKIEMLKNVLIRTFGEAWDGVGATEGLDAAALKNRCEPPSRGYKMGQVPLGVVFQTAQVDTGGSKFDVMITGWDLQRRRYPIDRFTIKQRVHADGVLRNIAPTHVQDDWSVLIDQVIDRIIPFRDEPTKFLPIGITVIDIKDGNATPFGVEFLRRVREKKWVNWRKVYGIMGAKSPEHPELGLRPKEYNNDREGKPIDPPIKVFHVGSYKLKDDVLATLGISDGSPGEWIFPNDFPASAYDEFFNEPKIEGVYTRNGPQESLDLGGYGEAARQLLDPDRKELLWDQTRMTNGRIWTEADLPIWARPIYFNAMEGDQKVIEPVKTFAQRFSALNIN